MADPKFSSREREGVYRLIVLLNSSLKFLVLRLEEMAAAKIFSPVYLTELKAITQKVETEINEIIAPE